MHIRNFISQRWQGLATRSGGVVLGETQRQTCFGPPRQRFKASARFDNRRELFLSGYAWHRASFCFPFWGVYAQLHNLIGLGLFQAFYSCFQGFDARL